jgi:predicted nucleotidyltransferase
LFAKNRKVQLSATDKNNLKKELVSCLRSAPEIRKIVVFGSFLYSDQPNDLDVAILQDSQESYLTLAMKYRKMGRPVARKIAIDFIPLKADGDNSYFLKAINTGEVIYENRNSKLA